MRLIASTVSCIYVMYIEFCARSPKIDAGRTGLCCRMLVQHNLGDVVLCVAWFFVFQLANSDVPFAFWFMQFDELVL